ncbi:MAG: acyl-CoA dehydrogenase family protein, partial [bacterium]
MRFTIGRPSSYHERRTRLQEVPPLDFSLNEEQKLLKTTVRDFAEAEIAPHSREWDEKQAFPR